MSACSFWVNATMPDVPLVMGMSRLETSLSHHRTAEKDLADIVRQSDVVQGKSQRSADGNEIVALLFDPRAGDGDHPFHDAPAVRKQPSHLGGGGDVLDHDVDIDGQAAGRDFPAEKGFDEHLLGALGVFHLDELRRRRVYRPGKPPRRALTASGLLASIPMMACSAPVALRR